MGIVAVIRLACLSGALWGFYALALWMGLMVFDSAKPEWPKVARSAGVLSALGLLVTFHWFSPFACLGGTVIVLMASFEMDWFRAMFLGILVNLLLVILLGMAISGMAPLMA